MLVLAAVPLAVTLPAGASTTTAPVAPAVTDRLAHGDAPFWVVLKSAPDLPPAGSSPALVREALTRHAAGAQAGLRQLLTARKAHFEPFWITDAIRVVGDRDLLDEIAERPEVARIDADPAAGPAVAATDPTDPTASREEDVPPPVDGVEWNIHRIGADRAWKESGSRGEGIVVANIDTGVMYDHPALAATYRGRYSTGAAGHDYNWFDTRGLCAQPCDESGHGTHVMGLEAGRAADGNAQMGVAPGARWIAGVMGSDLVDALRAGEWMLAPTDAAGENPRPDLAPDVVNMSWRLHDGGESYGDMLDALVAAGIFPVVAAGNYGEDGTCSTNVFPASLEGAYAVGNTTPDDTVSGTSSRGPIADGRIKPDIAAPGTAIRSSDVGPEFGVRDGTSQAAPQVAGAVALLWSAVPQLEGDVAATRELLDRTAHDIDDTACGGTADDNNAAGQGLLDVAAALRAAPKGKVGALSGTAVPDALVQLTGPKQKNLYADSHGRFQLARMVPGTYTWTATAFGYEEVTGSVTVTADQRATLPITMRRPGNVKIAGEVRSAEGPVAGATVTVRGAPARARTDAGGRYRLTVPAGVEHHLTVETPTRCALGTERDVRPSADTTVDFDLTARTDETPYGHTCTKPVIGYRQGTMKLDIGGSNGEVAEMRLPFPVKVYDNSSATVWISTFGAVSVTGPIAPPFSDMFFTMPDPSLPLGAILPFYSLLNVDEKAGVYTRMIGDRFVVEWRNVQVLRPMDRAPDGRLSVSLVIGRDGTATVNYRDVSPGWHVLGKHALIGMQDADGSNAFAYGNMERVVRDGRGFTIHPPAAQTPAAESPAAQTPAAPK